MSGVAHHQSGPNLALGHTALGDVVVIDVKWCGLPPSWLDQRGEQLRKHRAGPGVIRQGPLAFVYQGPKDQPPPLRHPQDTERARHRLYVGNACQTLRDRLGQGRQSQPQHRFGQIHPCEVQPQLLPQTAPGSIGYHQPPACKLHPAITTRCRPQPQPHTLPGFIQFQHLRPVMLQQSHGRTTRGGKPLQQQPPQGRLLQMQAKGVEGLGRDDGVIELLVNTGAEIPGADPVDPHPSRHKGSCQAEPGQSVEHSGLESGGPRTIPSP